MITQNSDKGKVNKKEKKKRAQHKPGNQHNTQTQKGVALATMVVASSSKQPTFPVIGNSNLKNCS